MYHPVNTNIVVIEVDGDIHDTDEAQEYDYERTGILKNYNLQVIRFRNEEIDAEFDKICTTIMNEFRKRETDTMI